MDIYGSKWYFVFILVCVWLFCWEVKLCINIKVLVSFYLSCVVLVNIIFVLLYVLCFCGNWNVIWWIGMMNGFKGW